MLTLATPNSETETEVPHPKAGQVMFYKELGDWFCKIETKSNLKSNFRSMSSPRPQASAA